MAANELKRLISQRVELLAKLELANAQHEESVDAIDKDMSLVNEAIASCVSQTDIKLPAKKRAKSRQPNHDAVAKRYADFEPAASGCLCGCGEDVGQGGLFVNGHHKKLHSIALAVHAGKLSPDKLSDAGRAYAVKKKWMGDDAE